MVTFIYLSLTIQSLPLGAIPLSYIIHRKKVKCVLKVVTYVEFGPKWLTTLNFGLRYINIINSELLFLLKGLDGPDHSEGTVGALFYYYKNYGPG